MRILFVAPYAPGSIRVRSFNLIRQLLRRGHQVTVVHPLWRDDRQSRSEELVAEGAEVVRVPLSRLGARSRLLGGLARRQPMQIRYAWSRSLAHRLRAALERSAADIVHFEHLRTVPYAHFVADFDTARVWDSVDCISELLRATRSRSRSRLWRLAAGLEIGATRRYESRAIALFDRVLLASARDRQALAGLTDQSLGKRLQVLASGVDLEAFAFRDPAERAPRVVFAGALSYHPNADAALYLAREVMPLVWGRNSSVQLVVVGPSPPSELQQIARRDPGRITVTGWVPSVQGYLTSAAVAAIPLRYGAGIQSKVLEAMACGTPIVADPRSALAVGAKDGRELLTADSAHEFADAILCLVDNPLRRGQIARDARSRVEGHFSWDRAGAELERHYHEAIAEHG